MKLKIVICLFALLLFSLTQSILFGGTTGKITGKITDVETGEPLPAANIVVQGSTMGAACDLNGNYVILNIPPGTYTLQVSMLGYQQVQFEFVRVSIDLTTRIDAALKPTALEGEAVVVTAGRELVTKDMTSSMATTSSDQIESLPVQTVSEVLRLNAGIIESDGRLHIRGGRPGEVAYWVDGISVTDVYDGRIGATVENASIQELQVISGTFNAEYGQAMSGIVNIVTKEGGREYSGEIKVYGGDYVSNDDAFKFYEELVTDEDPNQRVPGSTAGITRVVSGDQNEPLKKVNPIYNGEFTLSGPVPLLGNRFTFFTTGRYFSDEGYFYGANWFRPNGAPGDSSIVALNPYERISLQGKVSYQMSDAIKLNYNLFWNQSTRDRNYFRLNTADYQYNTTGAANFSQFTTHDYKYVPYGIPRSEGESFTHIFTLTHLLSPSTFYELRFNRYFSDSKQFVYENPTQAVDYLVSVTENPDLGITEAAFGPLVFDDTTPDGQAKLQAIIAAGGSFTYIVDPAGPNGYIDPDNINPPTSNSFMNRGMDVTHTKRSTAYWVGKADFTSQVNNNHQLKAGAEVRLHELELHGFEIIAATDTNGQDITPFIPAIPEVGSVFRHDYNRKPKEMSAYLQDKIEFNNIILNVGLRFDYFDANAAIPADPSDPNIYFPFKTEHIYKDANGDNVISVDEQVASNEYKPEERRAFMQTKVDAKMSLSPRLGIAFPITDRGVIHFSYGHFFQIPEFQYLYANPDFKVTSSSRNAIFGNPDLDPQKTVMYEIGLQQQLSDNIGIDVTLFYRDVRDWVGTSKPIDIRRSDGLANVRYSQFENKDYSNVRGITLKLEKRLSNNYSFRTDYAFQKAEGTYSNPQDEYNNALRNQEPVLALLPMNWDQTHTLNGQLIYEVSNWTFSLVGRYWSGRPYTPSFAQAEAVGASRVSGLTTNSARRPVQRNLDLTINKALRIASGMRFELFMNVYNLLDLRDETNVYGDTGTADYTTTARPSRIQYQGTRVSTPEDFVLQPSWYTAPRQVHFGVILGF